MKKLVIAFLLSTAPAFAYSIPAPLKYSNDMDWNDFDSGVNAIQNKQAQEIQKHLCDRKQPVLKQGEHGITYHVVKGQCVGELR